MPSHEEHCQDSLKRYGKRFDELHSWMDEPSTLLLGGHQIYRHDPVATPPIAKEMFGELADQACLDHIRMDEKEKREKKKAKMYSQVSRVGWWKDHLDEYYKESMEKTIDHYWGDDFLYELVQKSDERTRKKDIEKGLKRDRALISALFLTGGLPEDVLLLRKKNFDFTNKVANKYGAFLVKNMTVAKKRSGGKPLLKLHTFPIWWDDPLVKYLEDWVKNEVVDFLFPSPFDGNTTLTYDAVYYILQKTVELFDKDWKKRAGKTSWFRKQREYHLIEKHGFSVNDLENFFKVSFRNKITKKKVTDWENLLAISQQFKQEPETIKVPVSKFEQNMRILNLIYDSNFLFRAKKGATMFKEDNITLIAELFTPCQNKYHYLAKIASLANLFDVPLNPLKKLVDEPEGMGAINLVKTWLKTEGKYDQDIIKTWENIRALRNAEPIHTTLSSNKASWVLDALNFFGTQYPVDDYSMLWDNILEKFISSLESWQKILQDL